MARTVITCNCDGSVEFDAPGLSEATGLTVAPPCTALCTREQDRLRGIIASEEALICCEQETALFDDMAAELGVSAPATLDLRDRAGWTADTRSALPKMAALLAEATLPASPEKVVEVESAGLCLILGPAERALAAAEQLAPHLSVTVLLSEDTDAVHSRAYEVLLGRLRNARGSLGQFELVIDGLRQMEPGGRGALGFGPPQDGGQSACDIILDLRGDTPLFPAHEKRDGYLRPDPKDPHAVFAAIMEASHLTGTFEKTLHVVTEPLLCAHSRAEKTACTRCLDVCPTGAILSAGDHVEIDPMICAGCGACSSVCPSGAVRFDAPPVEETIRRVQTLARAFLEAGGEAPALLVHEEHGAEMIRLAARHGKGLPVDVIPLELPAVGVFGHAEMLAALAAGFAHVSILAAPRTDLGALSVQHELAEAIAGPGKLALLEETDPDALSEALYTLDRPAPVAQPIRPLGTRRQVTRLAAAALQPEAETLPLPPGAPYGAVKVNTDSCTLCLACVSLCPSGALGDNPDLPQLRFQEDACLQCGLCAEVCPEDAIAYEPRLNLADSALRQEVLNEEEPFACIECGVLFGSKSTIDRITEKLTGHSMFNDPGKLRMIQMCDNCRVSAQHHSTDNPFASKERPRPRTTDDYFTARKDH